MKRPSVGGGNHDAWDIQMFSYFSINLSNISLAQYT
jgi:hypothetical protein